MMQGKFRLRRPSTGTVLGALALLVAAASGGYAVAQTSQPEIVAACQSNKMLFLADPTTGQCPPNQMRVELTTSSYSGFARAGEHTALKQRVDDLKADVSQLQALLKGATRSGDTLTFNGINLQITNGAGHTGVLNGLGNLIVGYNDDFREAKRTGSHNLIVGRNHEYTSWGGIVGGDSNTLTEAYATALGADNRASGFASSVTGGHTNTASGPFSSVSGGSRNTASGYASSVSGGLSNTASGTRSSVSGGEINTASGHWSSVSGGESNTASGDQSSILGGKGVTVNTLHGTSP